MHPVTVGVGLTAVLAGPELYSMVQSGQISMDTALLRGAVMTAGCAFGAHLIASIVQGYQRAHEHEILRLRYEEARAEAQAEAEALAAEAVARASAQTATADGGAPAPGGPGTTVARIQADEE